MADQAPGALRVIRTRTDDLSGPLGIDDARPHLSWQLASDRRGARQCAYQIQAAGSADLLPSGDADLWDSGRVTGPEQRIRYAGAPLASRPTFICQERAAALFY